LLIPGSSCPSSRLELSRKERSRDGMDFGGPLSRQTISIPKGPVLERSEKKGTGPFRTRDFPGFAAGLRGPVPFFSVFFRTLLGLPGHRLLGEKRSQALPAFFAQTRRRAPLGRL